LLVERALYPNHPSQLEAIQLLTPMMVKNQKVKRRDDEVSSTPNRLKFLKFKEKKKNSIEMQYQDNGNFECNANHDSKKRNDETDQINTSLDMETQVGAFAVAGTHWGTFDVYDAELTVTCAQLVDKTIVEAVPLEVSQTGEDILNDMKAIPKKGSILRYSVFSLMLFASQRYSFVVDATISL
jgi:hypothetical protein